LIIEYSIADFWLYDAIAGHVSHVKQGGFSDNKGHRSTIGDATTVVIKSYQAKFTNIKPA